MRPLLTAQKQRAESLVVACCEHQHCALCAVQLITKFGQVEHGNPPIANLAKTGPTFTRLIFPLATLPAFLEVWNKFGTTQT
jgi:hypothetical protein